MRRVLFFILTLTFIVSVFSMGQEVKAEMTETSPGSFEYFEDIEIVQVIFGTDTSSALTEDGRLFMWGDNSSGQLGDGTKDSKLTPFEITQNFNLEPFEKIVQVSLGQAHAIALTSNGRVFTWGHNDYGTLGNGTDVDEWLPVDITSNFVLDPQDQIIDIVVGDVHCGALSMFGEVFTWGGNDNGILGDGTEDRSELPLNVTSNFALNVDEYIYELSFGKVHSMALSSEGNIFAWGDNEDGQFGDGTIVSSLTPVDVTIHLALPVGEVVTEILAGSYISACVTSLGRVFTWGYNEYGQLGDGSIVDKQIPQDITANFGFDTNEHIVQIVTGGYSFIAYTNNDRVFAWGHNEDCQLGTLDRIPQQLPYDMTSFLALDPTEDVLDISASAYNTAVLTTAGKLLVWGYGSEGQIGYGLKEDSTTPVDIQNYFNRVVISQDSLAPGEVFVDSGVGRYYFIALTSLGTVFTWGGNVEGELGDGTNINSSVPIDITDSLNLAGDEQVIGVSAGDEHCLILTDNGTVYSWGLNEEGQLGDGTNVNSNVPIELPSTSFNDETVTYIHANGDLSSAITDQGTVFTWGRNLMGQMADGTFVSKNVPTDVTASFPTVGPEQISKIIFGLYHTIVLTDYGHIFTLGYNSYGELGNGTTSIVSSAVPYYVNNSYFNDEDVVDISAGYHTSGVVTETGKVYTWGYNGSGQLGLGSVESQNLPVEIENTYFGDEAVVDIQLGFQVSSAITSTGNLYMWGINNNGQIGDDTQINKNRPTAVQMFLDTVNIEMAAADRESVLAITDTGLLFRWGQHPYGPLGGETQFEDLVPVQKFTMNSIEHVYVDYISEFYSDTLDVSIFPSYDVADDLFSIVVNGVEYLQADMIITDGRIDIKIPNTGTIDYPLGIDIEFISYTQGVMIETIGNTSASTFLADLEAPVFNPIPLQTVEVGSLDVYWAPIAIGVTDNSDGVVTLEEVEDLVDYTELGTYNVTIKAVDPSHNESVLTFMVEVVDTTSPVLMLNGDATVYLEVGEMYTDSGATFTDNYDTSGMVTVSGDFVDLSTVNTYLIEYHATDSSGNEATIIIRTVIVQDTTSPVIELNGSETITIEKGDSYTELGATFTDNYDTGGDAIVSGDTVDTNTVGTYTVDYDVEDANGNIAVTVSRTVVVEDTVNPIVSGVTDDEIYEKGTEVTIEFDEGSATLNGEDFTNGDSVADAGEYTLIVTDDAGNVTTTIFTIEGGLSALVYILIGVGVAIIGVGIYFIIKKGIFR